MHSVHLLYVDLVVSQMFHNGTTIEKCIFKSTAHGTLGETVHHLPQSQCADR